MTTEEMRKEFYSLYDLMSNSHEVEYMRAFGNVHKEMMEWMIANKPDAAQEWIEKLESIRWKNYLTQKEAETIVSNMEPKAPWSRETWRNAMEKSGYDLDHEPCFNRCALYATMNMIMSDSSNTLARYVDTEDMFKAVHDLAVDKLTDKDGKFNIRKYFNL